MSSIFSDIFHDYENRLLPNDITTLRNDEEEHEVLGERHGSEEG